MKKVMLSLLVLSTMQSALAQGVTTDQNFGNAQASYDSLVSPAVRVGEQQTVENVNRQLQQGSELGQYNDTYAGVTKFWGDDIVGHQLDNAGKSLGPRQTVSKISTAAASDKQSLKRQNSLQLLLKSVDSKSEPVSKSDNEKDAATVRVNWAIPDGK